MPGAARRASCDGLTLKIPDRRASLTVGGGFAPVAVHDATPGTRHLRAEVSLPMPKPTHGERHVDSRMLYSRGCPSGVIRMQEASLLIVFAFGLWLFAVGVFMALRPERSLQLLGMMAATQRINLTEQSLRILAGAALVIRSGSSKLPDFFEMGGWFMIVSSVVLVVMPLRWHRNYAIWWSRKLSATAVRALAPLPIVAGPGLVYAAL